MFGPSRWRAVALPMTALTAMLVFGPAGFAGGLTAGKATKFPIANPLCFGYYPTCWQRWPAECPPCPPPCQPVPAMVVIETAPAPAPPPAEPVGPPTKVGSRAALVRPAGK